MNHYISILYHNSFPSLMVSNEGQREGFSIDRLDAYHTIIELMNMVAIRKG